MPRIATHGVFVLARVFAGVFHHKAILCVSISLLTRNFAKDSNVPPQSFNAPAKALVILPQVLS